MYRILSIFLFWLLASGCASVKKPLKEAATLEQEGFRTKAFEAYREVYHQYGDTRALVGMKRVAQGIFDEQVQQARMLCLRENHEEALSAFEKAFSYAQQHPELELRVPDQALVQQSECRATYVDALYRQAEKAVYQEEYDTARGLLDRLRQLDRNHREAEYLGLLCDIIPTYQKGQKAYEMGLYREAHGWFLEVTRLDAGYKDALLLRDECLRKGRVTLAYLPVHNPAVDESVERTTGAAIKEAILELKDPFIQLVDRENINQIIEEQMKGMTGLYDETTVIRAGKLTGARYILTGELISYEPLSAPQRGFERKAYLGPTVASKKVRYTEYRLGRGVDATFRYQVLDAETGTVHATGIVPFTERDNVVWADFDGDHTLLYPGEWKWQLIGSREDVVYRDQRDALMEQFTGRRGPAGEQELRMRMMKHIAAEVARALREFRP